MKDKEVKYIVTLNNDTVVDKNFLLRLIDCAERYKKAGSIMAKMICGINKQKEIHIANLERILEEARSTLGWMILERIRATRDAFLPVNTKRRYLLACL